jgi:hypothetical protein
MDENQINEKLQKNQKYQGSFALDELKEINVADQPTFAIINLDPRGATGSHWIAIGIYFHDIYICDSLGGLLPSENFPTELVRFLSVLSVTRNIHITKQLQPQSSALCGLYCITFVNEMSKSNSFYDYIKLFSTNLYQNDVIVRFINKGM